MSSYSLKQLETIRDFGKLPYTLHCSCMGTGKTYSICSAFLIYCAMMERLGIHGLKFVLMADTQATAKRNLGNVLSQLAGNDFKYDGSKKDGQVRDARLFSHNIYICGSNTKEIEKFRGLSDVTGILMEEATHSTLEVFALINSRLRGEYSEDVLNKWPKGYCLHWWVGSTNPDHPHHYLKKKCDDGEIKLITWQQEDAKYKGATEYFERLKKLYAGMPALYKRNVEGEWTSAEGAVYVMFNPKVHILKNMEVDLTRIKYTIISVDYGSNHPTAILLIAKTYENKYIVYKEIKLQRTAPSQIVQRIREEMDCIEESGGTVGFVCVDPSAVGLKDEMDLNNISYIEAYNKHTDGIAYVGSLLTETKLAILEECTNLINEIFNYRYKPNSVRDGEVVKLDDDFCDALRYGTYTDFKEGW